jgi:hypothetical protein
MKLQPRERRPRRIQTPTDLWSGARCRALYLVCRGSDCRGIWISVKSTEAASKAAVELKTKNQGSHRGAASQSPRSRRSQSPRSRREIPSGGERAVARFPDLATGPTEVSEPNVRLETFGQVTAGSETLGRPAPSTAGFVAQSRDVTVKSVATISQAPRRNLLPPNNLYRRSPLLLLCTD